MATSYVDVTGDLEVTGGKLTGSLINPILSRVKSALKWHQQFFVCQWFKNLSVRHKKLQDKIISRVFQKILQSIIKYGWNVYVYDFSIDYNTINISYIIDIYWYLMKKCSIVKMLELMLVKHISCE